MNILIIEDEKITARDLVACIHEVRPDFTVTKILASVEAAIDFLQTNPSLDLIFSDIQLSDGLSFEIYKEVAVNAPIIFCTAYDAYALNAFETNGIAYLLKPFTSQMIENAIKKFEQLTQPKENHLTHLLQFIEQSKPQKTSNTILIYQGEKIIPISFDNIAILYLKSGIVKLRTFDHQIFTATETLEELEKMQHPDFFRANRQYLVHRKAIKNAAKYFNRRLVLHLHFPFEEKIIISKEKSRSFLDWLAQS